MLFLPATPEVVEGFMELAADAPVELSTIATVMTAPPMPFLPEEVHGSAIVMAFLCYAGDVEAGERALAPFRALATPLADMVTTDDVSRDVSARAGGTEGDGAVAHLASSMRSRLARGEILERLEEPVGQMRAVQLRTLGGVMASIPNDATAFAHRSRAG